MSLTNDLDSPKFFSQKDLEFWSGERTSTLVAAFVLGLSIADSLTEERNCKQDTIRAAGPYGIEIVFARLTKVIAVHMRFFII